MRSQLLNLLTILSCWPNPKTAVADDLGIEPGELPQILVQMKSAHIGYRVNRRDVWLTPQGKRRASALADGYYNEYLT